jgi:hypothetical protein
MAGRASDVEHLHAQRWYRARHDADRQTERRAVGRHGAGEAAQFFRIEKAETLERALNLRP